MKVIGQSLNYIISFYLFNIGMEGWGWGVARLREVGRSFKGWGVARLKGGGWFV